jgi:hypothetical protein
MRSIKDIYKISLNSNLLVLFYRICNKCMIKRNITNASNRNDESKV